MLWVKINGNTPLEGGTGYAKILKPRLDKVIYHFLLAGLRLDKVWVGVQKLLKLLLVLRQPEKIRLLLCLCDLSAAVGAFAVCELGLGVEALARDAVPSLVFALVDIPLLIELAEYLLDAPFVILVGGSYKS